MHEGIYCLDTGVLIKFLVAEEPAELSDAAAQLVLRALTNGRLVAPAFAWAEVGSVLRKKVRQGLLQREQAGALWIRFGQLPIEFIEDPSLRTRAWEIAGQYALPTLYDAAFLACTEVASGTAATREFWTADEELLRALEANEPPYVRRLRTTAS
ncbi:MAG: type II toxin-antitoxin system VapC family toxin [Chloroflexota bacterium]|nr:type II toxin-antitoxin system VapC family toxin [Chloroflexota bacterium]